MLVSGTIDQSLKLDLLVLKVTFRFRGAFCYVDAYTEEMTSSNDEEPTHLCRLRYFGSMDRWSFGFYKYSDETYELAVFPSGAFWGTPEQAFYVAASVYLAR